MQVFRPSGWGLGDKAVMLATVDGQGGDVREFSSESPETACTVTAEQGRVELAYG